MVKKLENIEKESNINLNSVDNLQKITITVNAENFLKLVTEIPILVNQVVAINEIDDGGGGGAG